MTQIFIAYYRVSTNRQGMSGLGLDAQRYAVNSFVAQAQGEILEEFTEVESGKRSNRPQLEAAIAACRKTGATLLIAKLDRLARNVHFISGLLEAKINFIAADMPSADKFMLQIYAAMAEEEGRRISERTKHALASAKRRGVRLGEAAKAESQKNSMRAKEFAKMVGPIIADLHVGHKLAIRQIALVLNERQIPAYRSGGWHATSVYRAYKRYQNM